MKRHVQEFGVKPWAGQDLLDLQAEPLKVLDSFFAEYGACMIKGCEVSPAGESIYNIAPGLVALSGEDNEGIETFKAVPFEGAENVTLPIYLTLTHTVITRAYADKKVRPIAYNYTAAATAIRPEGTAFLEITTTGGKRFLDVIKLTEKLDKIGNGKDVTVTFAEAAERVNITSGEKLSGMFSKVQKWFAGLKAVAFTGKAADLEQDETHRLVTDTEKANWADKYTKAFTYTRAEIEQKIADVVNSAPGTLDTLQELAAALGNDPNFATSITALIGGKADRVHTHTIANVENLQNELQNKAAKNGDNAESFTANAFFTNKREVSFNRPRSSGIEMLSACTENVEGSPGVWFSALSALSDYVGFQIATFGGFTEDLRFRKQTDNSGVWTSWREIWHSGNFNPDNILALKAKIVPEDEAIPDKFDSFQVFHVTGSSTGGADGYIWAQRWIGGNYVTQIYLDVDNTYLMAIRTRTNDGVWTSWQRIITQNFLQEQLNLKADKTDMAGVLRLHSKYYVDGRYPPSIEKIWKAGATISSISRFSNYKGQYRINHNLGHTNYTVILNGARADTGTSIFVALLAATNNHFDVETADDGSCNDASFEFTILLY